MSKWKDDADHHDRSIVLDITTTKGHALSVSNIARNEGHPHPPPPPHHTTTKRLPPTQRGARSPPKPPALPQTPYLTTIKFWSQNSSHSQPHYPGALWNPEKPKALPHPPSHTTASLTDLPEQLKRAPSARAPTSAHTHCRFSDCGRSAMLGTGAIAARCICSEPAAVVRVNRDTGGSQRQSGRSAHWTLPDLREAWLRPRNSHGVLRKSKFMQS